ncbi:S41 family peptidase [Leeuwenhoekiella nanhaiensis]|uniref:Tricorn protease homolog n=1 Tax=Leeuwenhoekiella nanhaiensis TaxID=1655491 RepID=A0A2G1VNS4_9FLAO|nr:S41 family peptidase [Leeuwenhoekiella nanhaiensis]PHQ28412.1 peptidase S41 [Leeuwenhoekiella nanhaiensis]
MKIINQLFSIGLCALSFSVLAQSINTTDTRLLREPALSTNHIAFIYADDLWVADSDGKNPRRLTIDEGIEQNPVFSPDGQTIAFSAEYDGNTDVFTIPVTGGIPTRLTYHTYTDWVQGFTPDGKNVLFTSQRAMFTNRYAQLFTIPLSGGNVTQLKIPNAFWASYSADGKHIAYTPIPDRFNQWKHYRGGTQSRIFIFDTDTYETVEIPKPADGSNDSRPVFDGNTVYFKSDRDGEFNLYSYDLASKQVTKQTDFKDFGLINLAVNNEGKLILEQAGYLHSFDPATKSLNKLKIGIATDLLELRPRFVSGKEHIRSGGISPSGARLVSDFRGDIVTIPSEKGDITYLTQTPGVHETYPEWSPDGKSIAYFSDASGEYALHIKDQNSNDPAKAIKLNGTGFYAYIHWSPDSKKIAFVDNGRNLYIATLASGKVEKVAQDVLYQPGVYRDLFGSWSADSNWLAYTLITNTNFQQAYIFSLGESKSYPISDGLANVTSPTFDPSGKYLYLTASTDAGPVVNWFDQSNQDMESTNALYLITLQKDVKSPFAKENDVEVLAKAEAEKEEQKDDKKEETPALKIDWDGIMNRMVSIPLGTGNYGTLSAPEEGVLYYLSYPAHSGAVSLHKYDLAEQKDEELMDVNHYEISANGKKMYYYTGGNWFVSDTGKKSDNGPVNMDAIQVKIDPPKEWANIFNEAWRVNRDYFYDPGMHGVDWDAMKKKYEVFLPDVPTKADLYRVMGWMFAELSVGHHRFDYRGDNRVEKETINGGLLGADYTTNNGRYQITKIYGGLNWNPDMKSPLTEPGVQAKVGEYIIKVDGKEVTASDNLYSFFENKAGQIINLTLSANANGSNAHEEQVTAIDSEWALRNRDWVEGNIKKVDEATNGQVAYVYVPNTATGGHEYFKRYFYPQADKKAIIVDERFNGGGQLADYVIDLLNKPMQSYWNFRYGKDMKAPSASIQGPKVMLIDETAGSGGDYLPYLFRRNNLGTLVGKRTWGGLVGVLGYPEFIDGGIVTAPNVAFYNEEGFGIENVGTPPDVEVEQTPKDVIAGKDPQLEKAIQIIMQELKENPPKTLTTPEYPDKTRN